MPATAKRGFRLPWMRDHADADAVGTQGLDGRPADAPSPESDAATEPEAEALDDLGSGPFGIAPAPRDLLRELDPVPDREPPTATEPAPGASTPEESVGEAPSWLRQGASADGAPGDEGSPPAESRPGIRVEPGTSTDSTLSVAHESAPASAWPQADLATRAAVASSHPALEASPTPDPGQVARQAAEDDSPASSAAKPTPNLVGAMAAATPMESAAPEPNLTERTPPSDAGVTPKPDPTPAPPRSAQPRAGGSPTTGAQPMHDRRDNPLLTGLVKAMRDSARTTREETSARLRVEAEARVVALRSRAAADAIALRTQADEDAAAIREWSKAEMARIRVETTQRIDSRRTHLAADSHALSSQTSRLVTEIETAVAAFETEMKRFFKALLAEEDPAQLATLAERMPEPPVLEALPEAVAVGIDDVASNAKARASRAGAKHVRAAKRADRPSAERPAGGGHTATRSHRRSPTPTPTDQAGVVDDASTTIGSAALDPETAAQAEAEALAGLDLMAMSGGGDWSHDGAEPSSNGAGPHQPAHETLDERSGEGMERTPGATADVTPSEMTGDTTSADGPEAEFVIEGQTRLIVGGLGDGGVAAFGAALRGVAGVGSVNVSQGDEGAVVFSVTHGSATDLRVAVPELAGFRAQVIADEGAILSVAAHDPH